MIIVPLFQQKHFPVISTVPVIIGDRFLQLEASGVPHLDGVIHRHRDQVLPVFAKCEVRHGVFMRVQQLYDFSALKVVETHRRLIDSSRPVEVPGNRKILLIMAQSQPVDVADL